MAQATDSQFRGINRTICIGLGGTGRDVLVRIRRLIVDRYGNLSRLPIVSFVHIDTDKAAAQICGLRTGSTYHGVDLSFKEAEKVTATMNSSEVTNFVQGLGNRSSYDRQGPYDNIGIWFPPQLLRNIKAVEEGAKGIRPVGRLAFFHNYQRIKTALESAERRTRGHEATLLRTGLKVEPGLNIFVVGSLCGGTGSGMFLDVAYSLRKLYGNQSAQIVGYLVISPELYGNNPNMAANTYAALKELNHYTTPGTKFEACYDMQGPTWVQEERPPFDYAYLVSNETTEEYKILEQRKLCNVIAHKIALDFSGELASVVKGMRDNFLQHMIEWDTHPRPNPQRYLTFGLAAIYFPRDIIVQIALTRISKKLVTFWLEGEGQSPDSTSLLERFIIQYRWHNDLVQKDGFNTRLAEAVQESNKTFASTLNTWRNSNLERAISECKNKEDRDGIRQRLPREFREQFRKTQPGETESARGIWLTRLKQTRPEITEQFKQNIDEFLASLLTPGNPNFSIKNARDWLDALQYELQSNQLYLQEEITNFGGTRKQEDLDKKWRDTEQSIEDIEQRPAFPMLNSKNGQVQAIAKSVVREVCELIKHNFDFAVAQEALQIVNTLQKYVQDCSTQVTAFSRLVENLKSSYEKEESDLRQLNFDEMSGEAIFDNKDIDGCYKILLPQDKFRSELVLVSKEITEPSGRGDSLAGFIEREALGTGLVERITAEQMQTEIDLTVDRLFGSRTSNIIQSVIKRFMQNYPISQRSDRLGQIMKEAEPLLRLTLSDPYFRKTPAKSSKLVGFKDTDEQEVQQFKTVVVSDLGILETAIKPTQAEDEILIVTEYAGFPLRMINGLEQMRNPYTREKNSDSAYLLHNDYRTVFTDIIPPDAKTIEELEDIFYPCLAFELLEQNRETQQLEFRYYDELRDNFHTAALSPVWNQALEELANRRDMKEALKVILDSAIADLEKHPNRWQEYYLPKLRQFIEKVDKLPEDSPNYPYRSTVVGVPGTTDTPAKEGIINRFRKKIAERVKSLSVQNHIPPTNQPNEEVITAEVIDDTPKDTPKDANDNRTKRRLELEQLKRDLEDGFITKTEYESERQKIFNKYPL